LVAKLAESWMHNLAYLSEYGLSGLEGHLDRVCEGVMWLGRAVGLSEEDSSRLGLASLTHDVGKISVAREVWLKPGRYSVGERRYAQIHVDEGYELLKHMSDRGMRQYVGEEMMRYALEIVRWHHENWDGTGYPDGLAGQQIPLSARITKIVDVSDALINARPYKDAWTQKRAEAELELQSGVEFDPDLCDLWVSKGGMAWFQQSFS